MKVAKSLTMVLRVLTTSLGHSIAMFDQSHKHDTAASKYVYQQEFSPGKHLKLI
jgi:hypothetical protein